jgi:hypothetical protein
MRAPVCRVGPFVSLGTAATSKAPKCRDRQKTHMTEDSGTLLYLVLGLLVVVGAIFSLTDRR